ncbi:thiol:disulfide interchange protein DsbA/DsbL [Solimonas marina]|uniref:Thiol:disulfide interchange protein n=1 Tax=Solimonas marina TaxID=2714601 RepID=A0A969W6Z5_9GAMM|nr:thiol:disulfide interchange protein DsbA/DsbL [Solimonas marina]NKF21044.1 thiol:disulfide interchange protein DsbA/DsbL [Solimonas marina]
MRHLFRGLLLLVLSLSAMACSAADKPAFVDGKDYKLVREASQPADPKRVEVAEFFWYGCPHCYAFDPYLRDWEQKKPADVNFVRYPNTLGHAVAVLHSKAYYTEQALDVFPVMHKALFDAIHRDHIPLTSEAQIADLFKEKAGVDPDKFAGTFDGFVVESEVRNAEALARQYGVYAVPTVVVGGKYETGPAMTGSLDRTIDAINFLVEKVRKERGIK